MHGTCCLCQCSYHQRNLSSSSYDMREPSSSYHQGNVSMYPPPHMTCVNPPPHIIKAMSASTQKTNAATHVHVGSLRLGRGSGRYPSPNMTCMYAPRHMTCMYPPHMTCMYPPPHMTCMYPPPHMTRARWKSAGREREREA